MRNKDLRKAIQEAGLKYWQVAEKYGVNDGNFSRLLREELPTEIKMQVHKAIEEAKEEYMGVK